MNNFFYKDVLGNMQQHSLKNGEKTEKWQTAAQTVVLWRHHRGSNNHQSQQQTRESRTNNNRTRKTSFIC